MVLEAKDLLSYFYSPFVELNQNSCDLKQTGKKAWGSPTD